MVGRDRSSVRAGCVIFGEVRMNGLVLCLGFLRDVLDTLFVWPLVEGCAEMGEPQRVCGSPAPVLTSPALQKVVHVRVMISYSISFSDLAIFESLSLAR